MSDRRLLFLDALRGFFILYVAWLHAMNGVVFGNNPEALNSTPAWLLMLLAPLAVLGTWAPIFAVISGAAHAYVLHGVMTRYQAQGGRGGAPFRSFMAGSIVTGIFLYSLSLLNMTFMHHSMMFNGAFRHTLFTSSLQQGQWQPFSIQLLFYNDALSLVAVNGILVTLLLYLLWRGEGFSKMRRSIAIVVAAAGAVLLASPLIHGMVNPLFFEALDSGRYGQALLLKLACGPNLSPIPYLTYGLVGAVIGIGLARRAPAPLFRRWGYGLSAFFIVVGACLVGAQGFKTLDLIDHPFPMKMHFINLGLMLGCCTFLVLRMEYCTESSRAIIARRTVWLRRVGLMALTIFCFESFGAVLFSKGYLWLLGVDGAFPRSPWVVIPFLACIVAFWNALLMLWEKANFKYSVEWWMSRLVCMSRKRPTVRLTADEVLHRPCAAPTVELSPAEAASPNQ